MVKSKKAVVSEPRRVGRPTSVEAETRTAELLDIATQVFLEYGFERTKISYIVARAGGSRGTLYARYATKDDLFAAVVDRKTVALGQVFAKTLSSTDSLASVLEQFGMNLCQTMYHPELRALFQLVATEAPMFPKLAKRFWNIGPQRAIRLLSECLAKHSDFEGGDPDQAAEVFCSLCLGLSLLRGQLQRDHVIQEKMMRLKVKSAIDIFLTKFGSAACRAKTQSARYRVDDE